jgi:hypothetical protein
MRPIAFNEISNPFTIRHVVEVMDLLYGGDDFVVRHKMLAQACAHKHSNFICLQVIISPVPCHSSPTETGGTSCAISVMDRSSPSLALDSPPLIRAADRIFRSIVQSLHSSRPRSASNRISHATPALTASLASPAALGCGTQEYL